MDAKRFVTGTLVGGAVFLATGHLIFATALGGFYTYALNAGTATGVPREPQLIWAVALAALSNSALVTLAIGTRASTLNPSAGVKIGAVVSFLLWFAAGFMLYGISAHVPV